MNGVGSLRYVLLGAGGFGAGGALAGASWPLAPLTMGASLLLVVLAGSIGGASLGLALRERRKVVALAVLGALGFTVGGFAAVFAGFVGFLPATSSGALNAMGAGTAGMIVGAIGGASLGVAFGDLRKILVLALVGALGFGVGLLAKFSLEEPLRLGAFEDVLLAVAGVIGGAVTGATVEYLEHPARHPRGERLLRLGASASVPLLAGLVVLFVILPYINICGERERSAFSEFPQYGGIERVPESSSHTGGCFASYQTSAPPEEVAAYLSQKLEAHGWTVNNRLKAEGEAEDHFGGTLVAARRDGLTYNADYESLRIYDPPRNGTYVAVHVYESR
jgi:hypothetical protein